MKNCETISTPVVKEVYLRKTQAPEDQEKTKEMSRVPYAQAVGKLMCNRPHMPHNLHGKSLTSKSRKRDCK